MKITPLINNRVNFGYDKKLNKELVKNLNLHPDKHWAATLSNLNTQCNELEDYIKLQEKIKSEPESKMADYVDLFLSFKDALCGFVYQTFENMNFAEREYSSYIDEFQKNGENPNDWRKDLCANLTNWFNSTEQNLENFKKANSESNQNKEFPSDILEKLSQLNPETKNRILNLVKPLSYEEKVNTIRSLFDMAQKKVKEEQNQQIRITPPEDEKRTPIIPMGAELTFDDYEAMIRDKTILSLYRPKADSPKGFDDLAGMNDLKKTFNDGIISYVKDPKQAEQDFIDYGKTIPRGILLFGPPGCGKTHITHALSAEANLPMFMLNISKVGSKYINETSKRLQAAFDNILEIAQTTGKPCLLFLDEIDSLAFNRTDNTENEDIKQISTLLQAIDSVKSSNVILIGATNKVNLLDPAIKRRFDSLTLVDLPDKEARIDFLKKFLNGLGKGKELAKKDDELAIISNDLQGYSFDSIRKISKAAALNAMERDRDIIKLIDFQNAIKNSTEEKPNLSDYKSTANNHANKIGFN